MSRLPRELFKILPVSLVGVVIGHGVVYRWFFGGTPHQHDAYQQQHQYLPMFFVLSGVLSIISLIYYVHLGYREEKTNAKSAHPSFWLTTLCLSLVQCILFIVMEVAERSAHGGGVSSLTEFVNSSVLIYGLLLQFVTAALVALSVSTATMVGRLIARTVVRLKIAWSEPLSAAQLRVSFGVQIDYVTRGPPLTS